MTNGPKEKEAEALHPRDDTETACVKKRRKKRIHQY